jgi:repressor LexA
VAVGEMRGTLSSNWDDSMSDTILISTNKLNSMDDLTPKQREMFDWIQAYIEQHQISPTYKDIRLAMNYASNSPVQNNLEELKKRGYLTHKHGKARSIQILKPSSRKIPILGVIAAGGLVEVFPNQAIEEYVDLSTLSYFLGKSSNQIAQHFALRVRGDSMIGAAIADGDVVILRQEPEPKTIKNGQIVAARYETQTTLKHLFWSERKIILQPANPSYPAIEKNIKDVAIEGVFVGLVRGLV